MDKIIDNKKIALRAVLREDMVKVGVGTSERYRFVMRWLLDDDVDDSVRLPVFVDDDNHEQFAVEIKALGGQLDGKYLRHDGTFGDHQLHIIQPLPYAMLEPPRDESSGDWQDVGRVNSKQPMAPIKLGEDTGNGLGVYHFLAGLQRSRAKWHVYKLLRPRFEQVVLNPANAEYVNILKSSFKGQTFLPIQGINKNIVDAMALTLAIYLVDKRLHPRNYREELKIAGDRIAELLKSGAVITDEIEEYDILAFDQMTIEQRDSYAVMVFNVLLDDSYDDSRLQLHEKIKQKSNVPMDTRDLMIVRGIEGGNRIDYWCSPSVGSREDDCNDEERGKHYPFAELMGLGLTIGDFSRDQVQSWFDSDQSFEVKVSHHQPPSILNDTDIHKDIFGDIHDNGYRKLADSEPFTISTAGIRRALTRHSSQPPIKPKNAAVLYDFFQRNITDKSLEKPQHADIDFGTGDGRITVLIDPGVASGEEYTANQRQKVFQAFNVYMMWETSQKDVDDGFPDTRPFFQQTVSNKNGVTSIQNVIVDDVKPWLVTRLYSYERDLNNAFMKVDSRHTAITEALNNPPWQPITERNQLQVEASIPDQIHPNDETRETMRELDDKLFDGKTIWFNDLRKGAASPANDSFGVLTHWDPRGRWRYDWTPEKNRDGYPVEDSNSQRYRIWVTAVDAFEQESDPIPVNTRDIAWEEDETYHFTPRRRISMMSPQLPRDYISYNGDTRSIQVRWMTPELSDDYGNDEPNRPFYADKDYLKGMVFLLKRRLRRKIEQAPFRTASEAVDTIPDDPQYYYWKKAVETLENETGPGWKSVFWSDDIEIKDPRNNLWESDIPIDAQADGFEYVAFVGCYITQVRVEPDGFNKDLDKLVSEVSTNPGGTNFWFPAVEERTVWHVEKPTQGDVRVFPKSITEVPTHTEPTRMNLELPSLAPPRGVKVSSVKPPVQLEADLIFQPPGLSRDLIINKLLHQPFENGDIPDWGGTGIEMTAGQAAVVEAALTRAAKSYNGRTNQPIIDVETDLRLTSIRKILASEVKEKSGTNDWRKQQLSGFRGFLEANWTYDDLDTDPPQSEEILSEAEMLRVYGTRISMGGKTAAYRHAAAKGECKLKTGTASYFEDSDGVIRGVTATFTFTRGGEHAYKQAMDTLAIQNSPALTRFDTSDNNPFFAGILKVEKSVSDDFIYDLTVLFPANLNQINAPEDVPDDSSLAVYIGQPITEFRLDSEEIIEINNRKEMSILLPIGGGETEVFCWWFVTVSYQGVETGSEWQSRPFYMEKLMRSTEPDRPESFQVFPPFIATGAGVEGAHFLERDQFKEHWLPSSLWEPPTASTVAPRIVISWRAYEDPSVLIRIERKRRPIEPEKRAVMLINIDLSEWEVLKFIENSSNLEPLKVEYLNILRGNSNDGWLFGKEIPIPDLDEGSNVGDWVEVGEFAEQLSGKTGLKSLRVSAVSEQDEQGRELILFQPGLVDYFAALPIKPSQIAMDGTNEYSYQLTAYIPNRSGSSELRSQKTEWSNAKVPGSGPVRIQVGEYSTEPEDHNLYSPIVKFIISVGIQTELANIRSLRLAEANYRVIIKRRTKISLLSGADKKNVEGWTEIGTALTLTLDTTASSRRLITDICLDRSGLDDTLEVDYKITVSRFLRFVDDKHRIAERIINAENSKEIPISIEPADSRGSAEVSIVVPISII